VEYAQLLNDASEVKIREGDPHAVAQNTTSSGSEGELVLSLPIQKPDVLVPVIELFLK
jgi:alpha-L-fucosidase